MFFEEYYKFHNSYLGETPLIIGFFFHYIVNEIAT